MNSNQDNFDALGDLDAVTDPNETAAPEGSFGLTIINAVNGQSLIADVFLENTLGSIAHSFKDKLGIQEVSNKAVFVNVRSGKSCSDSTQQLSAIDLIDGDTLSINPFGTVA